MYSVQLRVTADDVEYFDVCLSSDEPAQIKATLDRLWTEYVLRIPAPGATQFNPKSSGVAGLVHVQCPVCEHTFSTFSTTPITSATCFCGAAIPLTREEMVRFEVVCHSCEQKRWGYTNIHADTLMLDCKCGSNIVMHYDPVTSSYGE